MEMTTKKIADVSDGSVFNYARTTFADRISMRP
jgi:hypothetical protein